MARIITQSDIKRTRLESYQRQITDRVGRGKDHWERAVGMRNVTWLDFALVHSTKDLRVQPKHRANWQNPPKGEPVTAWVNNNRWIARCECGGPETVDPLEPIFFCFSCLNEFDGFRLRPIEFPADWDDHEQCLAARPDPLTRSHAALQSPANLKWYRIDELEDLEAENIKAGLPIRRRGGD